MSRGEIEAVVAKEHARFLEIFGAPAAFQAAPGWTATPLSVEVQEAHGILASSDTRGGGPFHALRADGTPSRVLEIPTTLPTLDELLALPLPGTGTQREKVCEFLRMKTGKGRRAAAAPLGTPARCTCTRFTRRSRAPRRSPRLFAGQVSAWKGDGVRFLTFEEICRPILSAKALAGNEREQIPIPVKRLAWTTLPGRATPVATGVAPGAASGASSAA